MKDFEAIYHQYFELVYKYSFSLCRNRQMAEDVAQDTFLKAMNHIDKYDPAYRFDVWLCQIAKNTYFSLHRKNKRTTALDEAMTVESFEHLYETKEGAFEVLKALRTLEEPYKEVFYLRMYGELAFAQIGELFGKNENWARVTFHRAKIKIKERMS